MMTESERYPETTEELPYGILTCIVNGREVGVSELSPKHITIRLTEEETAETVSFCCYFFETGYADFGPFAARLRETSETETGILETFEIDDSAFSEMVRTVVKEYERYIGAKLGINTCVPGLREPEREIPETFAEWKTSFETEAKNFFKTVFKYLGENVTPAVSLDCDRLCNAYLSNRLDRLLPEGFCGKIKHLYLGNFVCPKAVDSGLERRVLEKAAAESLEITIVTTWLKEGDREAAFSRLRSFAEILNREQLQAELEVNDWGYVTLLSEHPEWKKCFRPTLGRLLNKQRRDPRFENVSGFSRHTDAMGENSLSDPEYVRFLSDLGITRYEAENVPFALSLPNLAGSLHVPFYQTNTSPYCPLFALALTGERGHQTEIRSCPKFCEREVQLYAPDLRVIGRFNSLFGVCFRTDEERLREYFRRGIDRLVYTVGAMETEVPV